MPKSLKSQIFRNYNLARAFVRDGKLDKGRLDRGLGIALTCRAEACVDSHIARYNTTPTSCECPDRKYGNGRLCKGMIALSLKAVA